MLGRIVTGIASLNINGNGALSGTKHILQRSISAGDISIAVLPEFYQHQCRNSFSEAECLLQCEYREKLEVGYMTNPTDASTFTLIQQLNITNTSYTPATGSEYTIVIPNTVPAGQDWLSGIHMQPPGNALYYWDNVSWAPTQTMNVQDNAVKSKSKHFPNPFTDVIMMTDHKTCNPL